MHRAPVVAVLYLAITLLMTWPIASRIGRDLPGDLGDPAFVTGVLAWGSDHWIALLTGDVRAASTFWDAPIFYPERTAITYSEHLALHSLLTLPVYAVTRNPVLSYNLWFLATFVLSAFAMYLLVRDLTGRSGAAFVAGLAFGFAPYRVSTLAHLQVLSTHWMPFVLLGLRRYIQNRNTDPLLWSGAALWAQNLSSGYYMLFFGPFVALYALVEMATRGALRDWRIWRDLAITAAVALVATLPFAAPYLSRGGATGRTLEEVTAFSADLLSWLTASPMLLVWGRLQTFVKFEGLLFPGVLVVLLSMVGIVVACRALTTRGTESQGLRVIAIFGTVALILSFWLSLGPEIELATHTLQFPALYRLAWDYVPGFEAARVPARFAMLTVLALALLAGGGATILDRGRRRWLIGACGVLVIAEGAAFPLPTNGTWSTAPDEFKHAESRLYTRDTAPLIYRAIAQLDSGVVVAHFPFGLPEREIQFGYYAFLHQRRILNGYSGFFPISYRLRVPTLRMPLADMPSTLAVLDGDRVTHVAVHAGAWFDETGVRLVTALENAGWQRTGRYGDDYLLERQGQR